MFAAALRSYVGFWHAD